jgi:O-antigen/teichoic acid export membrane protein
MNLCGQLRQRFDRLSGRSKAVSAFFATSLAGRALGIACQLVQVPIAVRALGQEAFGLWMTLTSIGWMITFADFGIGQGAQNRLAEAFAADRESQARELLDSALVFLGGMGLFFGATVLLVAPRVDFTALFHLASPAVQKQARGAVEVALLLFCANFPLGMGQRLAYSRQEGWMHNIAQALGGMGSLGGVVLAMRGHWGLEGFIAAAQLPLVLANGGLLLLQAHRLGWRDLHRSRCRSKTMRELLGLGAYFGVQQIQATLLLCLPQVVISTCLGAAAVTPYNLAQRLFNLFAVIQNAFMLPLWPAYSDAKARGDFRWIRRTLLFSLKATVFCTLAPMAVGSLFARPILGAWVGRHATLPSPTLVWLLFAWNALVFLQQAFGYLLAGISEVRRLTAYAVVTAVASACLMYSWVHAHGAEGVVAGMIVGFMPYFWLGNVAEVRRTFREIYGGSEAPPVGGRVSFPDVTNRPASRA